MICIGNVGFVIVGTLGNTRKKKSEKIKESLLTNGNETRIADEVFLIDSIIVCDRFDAHSSLYLYHLNFCLFCCALEEENKSRLKKWSSLFVFCKGRKTP